MHRDVRATIEPEKKCEEMQTYGTDKKKEASLWRDVGERSVLERGDEFITPLIRVVFVGYRFA